MKSQSTTRRPPRGRPSAPPPPPRGFSRARGSARRAMEEEASGGARGSADPPAASSPVVPARKTARVSDARDFTTPSRAADHEGCCAVAEAEGTYAPRAQPALLLLLPLRGSRCARGWFSLRRYWRGSATGSSVSAAARAPGHHAGGVGSPSPPGAVLCEGAQLRAMPDYIRNLHR